ncbi:uncharacterized protein DNG_04240 [Cephalotrichum gorgonifer]|uniref:Zn(2)-C6 fungal-type domain-containing protein n=1 Tax=Cephalotrichum gorgonifer TaxID=2041049 RepID=A0AAE8MY61_9PEZI|nr:uncharacterized protein DNG_04240 [Cephalotrichum gorgonifer]
MDPSKWRISKACEVCRQRKLRCNGEDPCERCQLRSLTCVYREKARNRSRKRPQHPLAATSAPSSLSSLDDVRQGPATEPRGSGDSPSIHVHSVAATHRASPSCVLQLYYGPSSNFSMLHSIYYQIEGTRVAPEPGEDTEEVGPGLDLFSHRRLFFGDLADTKRLNTADNSAFFLDHARSKRYLERYLETYWHITPVPRKDELRERLDRLWDPPSILSFDSSENIVLAIAMAIGACTLDEESLAELLFQKAKQGAAKLDELVNVQAVQVPLMMISLLLLTCHKHPYIQDG